MILQAKLLRSILAALLFAVPSVRLAAQESALLQAGVAAPNFESVDLSGKEIALSSFAGKVVVLDFWATWCGPCIQSLPHVQEVAKEQKANGVVVLAVCTSDTRARYEAWMKDHAGKYPDIVFSCDPFDRGSKQFDDRASSKLYHVGGLPTKFVIGKDGKIAMSIVGGDDQDVRLEAGLKRAGIPIESQTAQRGEEQARKAAEEEAALAAELAANPRPSFMIQLGALKTGEAVPDFALVGADGKEFTLASLRGKPLVIAVSWHEIVPMDKLDEIARRYGGYGVRTLEAMVFTSRPDFKGWIEANPGEHTFHLGVDPMGKFEGNPATTTQEERMAFHEKTVVAKLFGSGMYPGMPIGLVIDREGRFVGGFSFGSEMNEGVSNLLLRAGVALDAKDEPVKIASAADFVIAPPPPPEAPVERLAVGAVAPDFEAQDLEGRTVKLSDFSGKIIVLDFWATWCGPCKASLPHTQEVASKYKDQGVVVLANCTSDARKSFEVWVRAKQGDYPDIVFTHDKAEKGEGRASHALYGVGGIPQQFVIGKDFKVKAIVDGYAAGEVLLEGAIAKAGVTVDPATLEKAEADQRKRDADSTRNAKKSTAAVSMAGSVALAPVAEIAAPSNLIGKTPPPWKVAKWVKGQPITEFEKGKVFVVDFWATWCGPCKAAIPHLTELSKQFEGKVEVIGVSISERQKDPSDTSYIDLVQQFVDKQGDRMAYRVAVDTPDKAMYTTWFKPTGTGGIPTAYIIDAKGLVAWTGIGDPKVVQRIVEAVLAGTFDPKQEAELQAKLEAEAQQRAAADIAKARESGNAADEKVPGYRAAMERGDTAAALAALDAAFAADPKLEATGPYQWKFMLLLRCNKPDEVDGYVRDLLKRMPDDDDVIGFASACIVACSEDAPRFDPRLALECAQKTLNAAKPDSRWQQFARWRLGWALYHTGDKANAIVQMKQARDDVNRLKDKIDFGDLGQECEDALRSFAK